MGSRALLQVFFPTQGWNPSILWLLHCRWVLYCWATREAHSYNEINKEEIKNREEGKISEGFKLWRYLLTMGKIAQLVDDGIYIDTIYIDLYREPHTVSWLLMECGPCKKFRNSRLLQWRRAECWEAQRTSRSLGLDKRDQLVLGTQWLGPQPAGMGTNMLSRISFTSAITGPENLPEYSRVTQEVIIVLLSHSLCPTLRPHGLYSLPGSSVQGIFQARILEWVAISSSGESSRPRDQTHISCGSALMGRFFATEPPGSPHSESERIWNLWSSYLFPQPEYRALWSFPTDTKHHPPRGAEDGREHVSDEIKLKYW